MNATMINSLNALLLLIVCSFVIYFVISFLPIRKQMDDVLYHSKTR